MTAIESVTSLSKKERDKEVRRVVASSYFGSMLEYYDFLLYGTAAALVFGPVFFSNLSPTAGTIASLGTFAAGYLARPFGGIVFGHFGDRLGRKSMLMISMAMMGGASVLIGMVPPAEMIGSWGAVLLILLRLIQGIAIGGEWGGAVLMSLEHADPKKRGFLTSFTNAGAPSGSLLGTLVMAVVAWLPEEDFMSWGWRIPFLLSAILVALGLFIRSRVSESPIFVAALEKDKEAPKREMPLLQILKKPRALVIVTLSCVGLFALKATFSTFGINFAVNGGTERSDTLFSFAVAQFIAIFAVLAFARISDRFGRRPVMAAGLALYIAMSFPIFALLGSGTTALVTLAFVMAFLCHAAVYGPMAAYVSEQFPTSSRYTGSSVAFQTGSIVAGLSPMAAAALYAGSGNSTTTSIFMMGICAISLVALWRASETCDNDLTR
ncbi:MAG: MFS transporter [Rhodococcus sp. (in: high G+C Gram-positive bacteria)]|nr:MAG: MFS transporter [Rhodococcus sp. (in: high G+C Gram-positive bacteria)]